DARKRHGLGEFIGDIRLWRPFDRWNVMDWTRDPSVLWARPDFINRTRSTAPRPRDDVSPSLGPFGESAEPTVVLGLPGEELHDNDHRRGFDITARLVERVERMLRLTFGESAAWR